MLVIVYELSLITHYGLLGSLRNSKLASADENPAVTFWWISAISFFVLISSQ
jgi:hypothetical protein